MKKGNKIKDLSLYNINIFSSKYKDNNKETNINNNNLLNKFKLECVIGKGGFGKVSYIKIINKKNRFGKSNIN